jgi:hypothetical protein
MQGLVPDENCPVVLMSALKSFVPHFEAAESTHPHLTSQFHELLGKALSLAKQYRGYTRELVNAITRYLLPVCTQVFNKLISTTTTKIPRLHHFISLSRSMWRMLLAQPAFTTTELHDKTQMIAVQLKAQLRRKDALTLQEVGAAIAMMLPTCLSMRVRALAVDGDMAIFMPVLVLLEGLKTDYTVVRKKMAQEEWIGGKKIEALVEIKERSKKGLQKRQRNPEADQEREEPAGVSSSKEQRNTKKSGSEPPKDAVAVPCQSPSTEAAKSPSSSKRKKRKGKISTPNKGANAFPTTTTQSKLQNSIIPENSEKVDLGGKIKPTITSGGEKKQSVVDTAAKKEGAWNDNMPSGSKPDGKPAATKKGEEGKLQNGNYAKLQNDPISTNDKIKLDGATKPITNTKGWNKPFPAGDESVNKGSARGGKKGKGKKKH